MLKIRMAGAFLSLALLVAPRIAPSQASPRDPRQLSAEEWRADLRSLVEQLRKNHKNVYHTTTPAALDSAVASLASRIPTLPRHAIIAGMMKIVAMIGDGHTNIYPTRDAVIGFHSFPIAAYRFKDGWFIRTADSAHASVVGSRILKIGGVPIEEAYRRVKPYIGRDNEMGAKFWAAYLLTMPEMLHVLELAPSMDSAVFELETRGKRRSIWMKSRALLRMTPADTDVSWQRRAGWSDARDLAKIPEPLWLQSAPDSLLWWYMRIPGTRVGYAQINQVRNGKDESFEDFSNRLLHFADTAGLEKLVLDVRHNRGGNGNLLKPLEKGLLRRPHVNSPGKLYVIMGRSTWSAAQFFLNDLREFSQATFVGEPSGSKGNAYGDSRQMKLPNSGITARASIYYWQDWHPLDTREWIAPDIAAEISFAEYASNHDPSLAAVIADLPGPGIRDQLRALVSADDTAGARVRFSEFRRDPRRAYVDGHSILDEVTLTFYNRNDIRRATWLFALAAEHYPDVVRSHLNLAAMYQVSQKPDLERKSLLRVMQLDAGNSAAAARLKALGTPRESK